MDDIFKERAEKYDKLDWTHSEQYMEKFLRLCNLKSHYIVCDIGTGTGNIAKELSNYCKRVEGIDISDDMLNIAKTTTNQNNIVYKKMNVEHMDYDDDIFDCITARMCFHHVNNDKKAIKECYRILKPNHRFVLSEGIPPVGSIRFYTDMFKIKEKRRIYPLDKLIDLFNYGGFKNIQFEIHKMENVSIKNWLDNSNLDKDKCKEIYNIHLDSEDYIKKIYNMKIVNGDILMDWLFAIISGIK